MSSYIYNIINSLVGVFANPSTNSVNIIEAFLDVLVSSPGLLLFVLIPFVGLGIGLIKRIIKLN